MSNAGVLFLIVLLISVSGCGEQGTTDQQKVRETLQKLVLQSRFAKVDLGGTGELHIDNLDKRMWVRFSNTENVVEVKYSLDDVVVPAEAYEKKEAP